MTATRVDDIFDPDRLRRNWVPRPYAEVVEEKPGEAPKPASIQLLERIATALRRDVPAREAALNPMIDRLRALLESREPKEGEKRDPKALEKTGPEIEQALDDLEDLTEALILTRPPTL